MPWCGFNTCDGDIADRLKDELHDARLIALSNTNRQSAEQLSEAWGMSLEGADGPGGLHEQAAEAKSPKPRKPNPLMAARCGKGGLKGKQGVRVHERHCPKCKGAGETEA